MGIEKGTSENSTIQFSNLRPWSEFMTAVIGFCPHVSTRLHISLLTKLKIIIIFLLFFPMARQPLLSTTLSIKNQQQKLEMTVDNIKTSDWSQLFQFLEIKNWRQTKVITVMHFTISGKREGYLFIYLFEKVPPLLHQELNVVRSL